MSLREKYKKLANEKGNDYVFNLLKKVDENQANKLHPNDIKRVIRALEIFETTGKPMSSQQNDTESIYDYKLFFLNDDREVLYERINNRVDKMFEDGLEEEVKNIIQKYSLTRENHSMQGIGYREFFDYFDGIINKEQLIEKIKQNSRNYAKRQITWFKHMKDVQEYNIKNIDNILLEIKKWLNN
jgi:tRNA dimethylallyltransferase